MTKPDPDTPMPLYVSIETLARLLEVSETTVRGLVERGVIPPAIRLTNGTVRWRWATVDAVLASLQTDGHNSGFHSLDDQQDVANGIAASRRGSKVSERRHHHTAAE